MANNKKEAEDLREEIAQLRDLLRKTFNKIDADDDLEDLVSVLDSAGRAAPQLAKLMQAQRELDSEEGDPMAVLREALLELEKEWPELRECREGKGVPR